MHGSVQLLLCLSFVGTHDLGAARTRCGGDHTSRSQAWGLTIQATAVVEPIQRGWNKRGGPRAVGEPDGPNYPMQGAQKWTDHGKDLTRENLLLQCLGDVKSETSKDREWEGAWANASNSQHRIDLVE